MITRHSLEMAHERLGLNEKKARRNIELAYTRGKRTDAFRGSDLRYLMARCEEGCVPVVYQDAIYIFNPEGVCVTVYQAPRWFGSRRSYDGKERVRDMRRCLREREAAALSLN